MLLLSASGTCTVLLLVFSPADFRDLRQHSCRRSDTRFSRWDTGLFRGSCNPNGIARSTSGLHEGRGTHVSNLFGFFHTFHRSNDRRLRGASAPRGVPTITGVSPASAVAGSQEAKITVSAADSSNGATVLVNGSPRITTYLNKGQLASVLTSADLAQPRTLRISVAMSTYGDAVDIDHSIQKFCRFRRHTCHAEDPNHKRSGGVSQGSLLGSSRCPGGRRAIYMEGGLRPTTWRPELSSFLRSDFRHPNPNGTVLLFGPGCELIFDRPQRASHQLFCATPPAQRQRLQPQAPTPTPTAPASALESSTAPELPRSYIDTDIPTQTGLTINVPVGGDFQGALNGASCGDTVQLAEGATFTGNFVLPVKSCDGWVVVRTSAPESSLPAVGTRVAPTYSHVLPKIVTPNSAPAIAARFGASHYRFVAVEITTTFSTLEDEQYGLVDLGEDPATGKSAIHCLSCHTISRLTAAIYTEHRKGM